MSSAAFKRSCGLAIAVFAGALLGGLIGRNTTGVVVVVVVVHSPIKLLVVALDAAVLERARDHRTAEGLERIHGDARAATDPSRHAADVIFVGNFSIGEIHERADLVRYLGRSRERLRTGGVFVCDTYGGPSAFRVGAVERSHWVESGVRVRYVWEQREADPFTARVVCAMHFRLERGGEIFQSIEDAFV